MVIDSESLTFSERIPLSHFLPGFEYVKGRCDDMGSTRELLTVRA